MTTYREAVYMVLDLLKEKSDDSFYTEEHVIFLLSKIRSLLLERKYKMTRNGVFNPMPDENRQQICLDLEPVNLLSSGCAGNWLRSTEKIPDVFSGTELSVYPVNNMLGSNISFIPSERMPYVGYNKWLKNIIYCSKGGDGYLYMSSSNPQFMFLDKIKAEGVFSSPEDAAKLSCDGDGESGACEMMDTPFPLEDSLVPSCIEMVVQELSGARYAPEDTDNNAKDDLGEAGLNARPSRAVRRAPAENNNASEEESE